MTPDPEDSSSVGSFLSWLLSKGRYPCLAAILAITAALAVFALRIPIERGDDSMVSGDAAQRRTFAEFKRRFGGEEMVLAVTHPRLLEPEGIRLVDSLTGQVGRLEGVSRVYSLTNATRVVAGPAGAESAPFVPRPFELPGNREKIFSALEENPRLSSLLVSRDRRTAAITIEVGERQDDRHREDEVISGLRKLMGQAADKAELHLTGIGVQKHDVENLVRRDTSVLVPLSALVLMVLLGAAFRRISGILIPMAVKGISLVWTMGIYALAGNALNPITALLPPLIIVLSISTSVHIYSEWLRSAGAAEDRNRIIVHATRGLIAPCLYTALTTALGLLSLLLSETPAVRQFGIFGALGVLISFGVSVTLVPIALGFLTPPGKEETVRPAGPQSGILQASARIAGNRPWWVVSVAACLSLAGIAGITGIRNNTDLVRFLKASSPLYRDTMFVDRSLAGVYSLEFLLSRRDGMPLTGPEDIGKISAFQEMAARQPHVAAAYSVADPLLLVQRAETGNRNAGLPSNEEDLLYDFDLMRADREHSFIGKLMTEDLTGARVSVRIHAVGTMEAAPLVREIEADGKRLLGDSYLLVPTGSFYQISRDSNLLVRRQGLSLALCLAAIPAAVYLLFRSASLTAVALIPTFIPVLLTGGMMGILGIDLSTGTAMIFPVVLGLGVDNTIHYLARYRREIFGGELGAAARTTAGIGRPLAASTLILAFGFGMGAFGSFKPTIHFSLLAAGAMIASLACVLLVLPACLELADRARRRASP